MTSRKNPPKEFQDVQEDTFNGNLTAIPKDVPTSRIHADPDLVATPMDFGEMNLEEAIESGYTDEDGHAVSAVHEEDEETATGALTDLGAGRSAVVHPNQEKSNEHRH